ncbi:MAG TPA: YceI family protein [Lacunisphaera sp.]|nr:YceI family protein [Lacunisphaera sp.]
MKKLIALSAALALAVASRAELVPYKIDSVHSSVGFSLRHLVSKFSSSFTKVSGTINYDDAAPEKSNVEATVDIASVSTANEKRDNHIKSPDFFDAAKFPTATFKSKSWKKTGEGTFDITGDLTIKDVTKEVVLKATLLGSGPGMGGATVTGWEAMTTLKKSDFGVAGPAMLSKALGDDVAVTINIEAGYKKA